MSSHESFSTNNNEKLLRPVYSSIGSSALSQVGPKDVLRCEKMSELAAKQVLEQTGFNSEDSYEYIAKNAPPKYALGEIDSAQVFLSDVLENIDDINRPFIAMYIKAENEEIFSPRLFYNSNSSMLWRFLPKIDKKASGGTYFDKSNYGEDAINAPFKIQHIIEDIRANQSSIRGVSESAMAFSFDDPAISSHDIGDLSEFLAPRETKYNNLTPGIKFLYKKEVPGGIHRVFAPANPEDCVVPDELNPQFDEVVDTWQTKNNIYGEVTAKCFDSKNGELRYLFFQNHEGRAWVGGVELNNTRLSSVGVKQEFINPGSLATPLYEYHTRNTWQDARLDAKGFWGNPHDRRGTYVGMDEYINKIPMVQEFLHL